MFKRIVVIAFCLMLLTSYNVHACQDTKLNFLVMNSFREFYAAA